jgi:hypothetical protein
VTWLKVEALSSSIPHPHHLPKKRKLLNVSPTFAQDESSYSSFGITLEALFSALKIFDSEYNNLDQYND